jgi:uroporphyrin-III C-methyltransferase/precorrin-2 dehydrogenase/sirohydrochlorin ferrochelatase
MAFVNYHPVFLALEGKKVLIVGGGNVAMEKLESLLPTGAQITVVSPTATREILEWHLEGRLHYIERRFAEEDAESFFMVIAATDDPAVNAHVFHTGERLNRLANSVDDPENCNFIMAAITRHGPMQAAISSAGCSPALAQRLRRKIANDLLTPQMGELADFLGSWRPEIKRRLTGYKVKQAFWESVIDSKIPKVLEFEGREAAHLAMEAHLSKYESGEFVGQGKVTLVGAGPGDPDLITVKGLKALEQADVVLYDRLIDEELLKRAKKDALLVDVGKTRGECGKPRQDLIHALLIEHALRGKRVVRLKGGDPFVFGRGGEEVSALREAGIAFEIVPGVSSAIAAPGAAQIPVTHRGVATGFAVFTAHGATDDLSETVPWESIKSLPTLVFLMGVEKLPEIVEKLRGLGRPEDLPIAVISHATLKTEQVAVGTLATIVETGGHLPSPATIVVGNVVNCAKKSVEKLGENRQRLRS